MVFIGLTLENLKPALADPSTNGATFIAYQSGDASVVLVFYGFTETGTQYGLDYYEIRRDGTLLEPNPIPISASSFEDIGQGLVEGGGPYSYTITVVDRVGNTVNLEALYKDAYPDPVSGIHADVLCPDGIRLFSLFSWEDCNSGDFFAGVSWGAPWGYIEHNFPAPLAPIHPKYLGVARSPGTGGVLPGAQVSVYPTGGAPALAEIYADRYGFFPLPNPITADAHGRYEFYVPNGRFDINVVSGSESYTFSDVTIADPRYARAIKADSENPAMTLVTRAGENSNPDGNFPLLFTAPGNQNFSNDNPPFYRIFANAEENGWALTYNAKWKGSTGEWFYDDTPLEDYDATFFRFRNDSLPGLEFGVDQGDFRDPPQGLPRQMETMYHIGPDKVHFKSLMGTVGIERIAGEDGITQGDVVILNSVGKAFKASTNRALYPFIVTGVENPNGISTAEDKIFLSIGGSNTLVKVDTIQDPCVTIRVPLVTSGGDPGKVVSAPGEMDVRRIVGYSLREGCLENVIYTVVR